MSQRCLNFACIILLIVVSVGSATSVSGSCASIGYSISCCPSSEENDCQATDGDCFCSPDCHMHGDCCEDVHCPAHPRTCADVGITQCCSDPSSTGQCDVHFKDSENNRCSCNASCHERNDCCPDAQKFCLPETCNGARKYPNCCKSNRTDIRASACHVPGGNCYCDPLCKYFDDCCDDAPKKCSKSSESDENIQQSRPQSFWNGKVLSRRRFYNRGQRIHQQRANANYVYEEAPADQQVQLQGFNYMNRREFRGKRHVNGQPSA